MSTAARNSLKLSFFTIISRILGVVRDHYQAVFFGTGAVAAAWEVAYMLPNMLRNLLAEGSLSQAFIPVYARALDESEARARRVAGVILTFLFGALVVVTALGILLMPYFIPIFTGKGAGAAALTVYLAQVMFAFILMASITAIFAGVANAHNSFSFPALSPILLNLVLISGYFFLDPAGAAPEANARFLAWIVLLGGGLQLALQAGHIFRSGWTPDFALDWNDPALKKIWSLMAPAALGASVFQINQLFDIAIASYMIPGEEAIPALRFAQRLIQLPTGVIGVALSTAILPALARMLEKSESERVQELDGAISFGLFVTAPAGIAFFFLGEEIINIIYFGGRWDAASTAATWSALQLYALGVPFFSLNKALTSAYYAHSDARTPVRILFVTVAANLALNLVLAPVLFQGGIALSSAITSALNSLLLALGLRKKHLMFGGPRLAEFIKRAIPLWLLTALAMYLLHAALAPHAEHWARLLAPHSAVQTLPRYAGIVTLLAAGGASAVFYLSLARILGLRELETLFGFLRRRRSDRKS